jgi:hypothetical protein
VKSCIFLGPTLPAAEVSRYLSDVEILAPVQAGSVRRALHHGFTQIGIIDGFFEQVPTVWHKEILFAMSAGARVYGGSSMGALRAAELHSLGMIGVGAIFAAYRDGELEDDDEVAVVHAPADAGFAELSTAMANLRFGLRRARELGIIEPATEAQLVSLAKGRYYAERSWKALFHTAKAQRVMAEAELAALVAWVEATRPNQKRDDACLLLSRMAEDRLRDELALPVSYTFEPTDPWVQAERAFAARLKASVPAASQSPDRRAGSPMDSPAD